MNTIRFIRTHMLNMSVAELAALCKTSASTVSRWENDISSPTLEDLRCIRDAAGEKGIEWNDLWFFESPTVTFN